MIETTGSNGSITLRTDGFGVINLSASVYVFGDLNLSGNDLTIDGDLTVLQNTYLLGDTYINSGSFKSLHVSETFVGSGSFYHSGSRQFVGDTRHSGSVLISGSGTQTAILVNSLFYVRGDGLARWGSSAASSGIGVLS